MATASGVANFDTLSTCQSYWVTVTSVNCVAHVRSQPYAIGVKDPLVFQATALFNNGQQCTSWINDNLGDKIASTRMTIISVLNGEACQFPSVTCTVDNSLTCGVDQTKVTYR